MPSIADVFFGFRGDDAQLQVDAAKAGAKAGQTLGQGLSGGATTGIKVIAGAAAGLFGVALKGGLDLTNAMARFRAETGATDEEAKQAQATILELYKHNTEGFDTLAGVLAVVHNGMHLVGDDAQRASQLILDFARATHQEAVPAANELDSLTKVFNLDAAGQVSILDQLVASHQKYGGSISDNITNLTALGPALLAANLSWSDGIGLLNLFTKAGVDAATAPIALQKALTKVHSPEELQKLIADIGATVDPFERAQKAAALFGARAGAKLADALSGSSGRLADFTVANDQAAGAVQKASDAIENTPLERLTVILHNVTGPLAAFASGLGAPLQTLGGLGSGLAAVGLATDKLGLSALRTNAAMLLGAIATQAQAAAYLILHPQFLLTAVQLGVISVAQGVYTAVTWLATAATTALGIAVEFLLSPIGLILVAVGLLFLAWNSNFLGIRDIVGAVVGFIVDHLGFLGPVLDGVGKALGALFDVAGKVLGFIGGIVGAVGGALDHAFNTVRDDAAAAATDTTKVIADHIRSEHDDLYDATVSTAAAIPDAIRASQPQVGDATSAVAHTISSRIAAEQPVVEANMGGLMTAAANIIGRRKVEWAYQAGGAAHSIGQALVDEGPNVLRDASNLMSKAASAIRDKRSAIDNALDQLKTDIKNRMSATGEIGHDAGIALSKRLSDALHSGDPVVRAQAEATRDLVEARLLELVEAGGKAGKDVQAEIARNMKSKDPDVRAQATRTKSLLDNALHAKTTPKTPGNAIADQLNANLQDKGTAIGKTAYSIGRTIYENLVAGVTGSGVKTYTPPAGSHVSAGGVTAYALGTSYVPYDQLAYIHQGEAVLTPAQAEVYRDGGLGGWSGPLIGELNVDASGHANPAAVGDAVRRAVGDAVASTLRDQTLRFVGGLKP